MCLRVPGLVFGVAELLEVAEVAFGLAGNAHLAPVVDDLVGEVDPAVLRDDLHQLLFNFLRRVAFGKAEAARNAEDMGVNNHAFGFFETDTKDNVGSLAGGSGDGDELGEGHGDMAAEVG